jgi:predicted ATPase/DNA-binding SARP family transcriptional activator
MGGGAMTRLQVCGLGPLAVVVDGVAVAPGGPKQRALLSLLTLRANAVVGSDTLVDVVWGSDPPARPGPLLQVYAANLRRVLDPVRPGKANSRLLSAGGGYRLRIDPDETDLSDFDRLVTAAQVEVAAGDLTAAAALLADAVGLWRGPPFPDLTGAVAVQAELAALEDRQLAAVEDLLELNLALGQHLRVAAEATELIGRYPFRERLRAAQIAALYRGQRQGEALAACRAARRFLADELGAEPGPQLVELERAVLAQDPALQRPGSAGLRTRPRSRLDNLPTTISTFVGRADQLAELHELLGKRGPRLLTLTGPGGTGKTRLALAAAVQAQGRYDDGVCWVGLEPVADPAQVLAAVADALGVSSASAEELPRATLAFLHPRQLLLVLDNFEHVIEAWPLITQLLEGAPRLTVMVTSRTALRVTGEQRFEVPQMGLPPTAGVLTAAEVVDAEAVQLFAARAGLVNRHFRVDDDAASPVAALCRRLDGLPLAIELAAARIDAFPAGALLRALEDVLGVLTDGPRDATERQRTLRGAIAWSYQLLTPEQRRLFAHLAVFAAPPDFDAVAAVTDTGSDTSQLEETLDALVRHSLLQRDDSTGRPRYPMLQTVRAYAAQMLQSNGDEGSRRQHHAQHYLALAKCFAAQLDGPGQAAAFARLHAERPDLDAALAWASGDHGDGGDLQIALGLIGHLWQYWQISGDIHLPRERAAAVLASANNVDPVLRAPALSGAGTLYWLSGDLDRARSYHHDALDDYTRLGHRAGAAWSKMCIAVQDVMAGELDSAAAGAQASLELGRVAADQRTVAASLNVLGVIAFYRGDGAAAEKLQQSALAVAQERGDRWLAGKALINLSDIAESLGEWQRATGYVLETLRISKEMGDHALAVFAVEAMAELRLRLGAPRAAARLLAAAHTYRIDMGQPLDDHERGELDDIIEQIRAASGQVGFAVAWAEGVRLSLQEAVQDAIATGISDPASSMN